MKKRESIKIKVWMLENGVRQSEISRAVNTVISNVCRTIGGERNCRSVLRYLLDKGCPAGILDLPEDMREAA